MTPRVHRHFRARDDRETASPPVNSGGSGTESSEGCPNLAVTYSGSATERGVVVEATLQDDGASEMPVVAPRRWWVLVLRLLISVAMLGVLLWRVPRFS